LWQAFTVLFGFGHLTPSAIISSFVAPSMVAFQTGGLKLLAGMTLLPGVIVVLLSRVLSRWKALFPPEAGMAQIDIHFEH